MPTLGTDSYADLIFAEDYFLRKMHTQPWDQANDAQRSKALFEASIRIDRLNFKGCRTSATQPLAWPRDSESVPDDIKIASCELAMALLDGVSPEMEYENLATSSEGMSSARTGYDRSSVPEHFAAGIPSLLAWQLLRPYLVNPSHVKIYRV